MMYPAAPLVPLETWRDTTNAPDLLPRQIHLWRIDTALAPSEEAMLWMLAPEERYRAEQFRLQIHRHRYLTTQSTLRIVLASYLSTDPVTLRFARGPHGKPCLERRVHALEFNLTTSDDLSLLAVTRDQALGIDCEQIRPRRRIDALMAMIFLPEECALLEGLPLKERLLRFYQGWTRLEAQVKATGLGLYWGRPLSRATIHHTQGFIPAEGFVATLASATPLPHPGEWLKLRWSQGVRA